MGATPAQSPISSLHSGGHAPRAVHFTSLRLLLVRYKGPELGKLQHSVVVLTSVHTTAAAAAAGVEDNDAGWRDVTAAHPAHLLLSTVGSSSGIRFVFYSYQFHYIVSHHCYHRNGFRH